MIHKKAETFTCKGFDSLTVDPNYWTIDESNINMIHKKAETFTCKGFDSLTVDPNYWTIDESNINNRETERSRTCSAFDMRTKAEWMFYRYFLCNKVI